MANKPLSQADLVSYESAAAGHDGVLQSAAGDLVIKPCTPAEVSFYETCAAQNEPFLRFMPNFMGTLALSSPEDQKAAAEADGTAATLKADDPGPLKGKKLETGLSIVLENIAGGFERPNVMDLKLGARLWDDKAPLEKRRRLDDVANKTTSGSLGFRIAGMRVWEPKDAGHPDGGEFKVFDKMYGRQFDEVSVVQGFEDFFGDGDPGQLKNKVPLEQRAQIIRRVREEVEDIKDILEAMEVRMYSASILIAFEGDPATLSATMKEEADRAKASVPSKASAKPDGEDDEDDEAKEKHALRVVMIDFAHATFVPGEGPDQNVLAGVKSVLKVLDQLK